MVDFKAEVLRLLRESVPHAGSAGSAGISEEHIEIPQPEFGDYAFPCFLLAKTLRKSPVEIASQLAMQLSSSISSSSSLISKVEAKGPYLNFFVKKEMRANEVLQSILGQKETYGQGSEKGKKVVIEYPSPNTNKPLHLGHVRNMLLGQSLSRILSFAGFRVFQVNLNNDRGVHICKAMLAYKLFGQDKQPDKKPDHFVGDFYVLYSKKAEENPELEQDIQQMLRKWEAGDPETIALWKKINAWALEGFAQTYRTFGITFDKVYNESDHYKDAKEIVLAAYEQGLIKKDVKGNLYIELKHHGLPDKILLRADGTSIYVTQDIKLAKLKYDDFKMDTSVYIVGSEQILHFQQLFKILEILDIYSGSLYHLAHGMVYLPEGKMKSREGKVVDADDIVAKMISLAKEEILKRHSLSEEEVHKRATQIGLSSLRFFILKYDPLKDFVFHPEESLSFEGETGPYVQYAHARICSILKKHGKPLPSEADFSLLAEESLLLRLLSQFPQVVEDAARQYKPLLVARYLLDISQAFNNFYHAQPILAAPEKVRDARLLLIEAIQQVLKNGLQLLAIEAPEEM